MQCKRWTEDKWLHTLMGRMLRASVIRCTADEHEPGCGGLLRYCDKEQNPCPFGVRQGPDTMCQQIHEFQDCGGDQDLCTLPNEVQAKIDWNKKEVAK